MTNNLNMPTTVHDLLDTHARSRGDQTFLIFEDTRTSYQEMATRTTRLANGLAQLGMTNGDRVAIMSSNRPEFLDVWLASSRLGGIEVPVNTALRGKFLSYILENSGAKFLAISEEFLPQVAAVATELTALQAVIVFGEGALEGFTSIAFDALLETGDETPIATKVSVSSPVMIGYTSGTTGRSKGVVHSHSSAWYAGFDAANERGLTGDDVFSTSLPLFHGNAQHLTTMAVLAVGATLALEPRFSASAFWERMAEVRATHVNLIGAMMSILRRRDPSASDWTDYPRMAFGGPLSGEDIHEARERWNLFFVTGYGSTESGIVTYSGTDGLPEGSCGKASRFYEVQLVDDNDQPVAVGEVGEFVTRPKRAWSMMTEYWGMPEKMTEAFQNLWYHTGDLGRADADGYYYFVDRKKDAIRRRGENISSFELEEAIREYPGVAEVATIAVPSELSEDEIKVCLRPAAEVTLEPTAFHAWAQENLPRYMVPRFIEIVDDFPRTATQRIEKYRLRDVAMSATTWDSELGVYLGESQ